MFKKIFGIRTEKDNNDINIRDLYDEIEVLKEEIEANLDMSEKKDKDIKELSFKVNVLSASLREKEEETKTLLEKISILNERLDKPNSVSEKLFQTIKERDLAIDSLKKENEHLRKSITLDMNEVPVEEILKPDLINYRILIKDYYEPRKYEEFKKICQEKNLIYIEDLEKLDFDLLDITKTKIKNAKNHYEDYLNKKFDERTRIYLLKGSFISEYFFRFRSFVNYCKSHELTYMIELDDFDFEKLSNHKFSTEQIKKIEDSLDEFNILHRIRR